MDVDGAGAPGGSPTAVTTRVYNTISIGKHAFTVDARYTDLRPIGRGGYGLVASALDTVTNERVAIKRITNVFDHVGDALRILREVRLLAHLRDHPNIVGLRDIMVEPAGSPAFHTLYLVTALFDSDLDKVVRSGQPLTDAHAQFFTYQALRGVKYIHSAITLHRDLKPANLLVNADCRLAICDFNLGRGVDLAAANKLTAVVGTPRYRAPELLFECDVYGPPVDVWALGCILGEVINRKPVFDCGKNNDLLQLELIIRCLGTPSEAELELCTSQPVRQLIATRLQGLPPTPWQTLFPSATPLALDLLSRMLAFDQRRRISIRDALAHPYLASVRQACVAQHGDNAEPLCQRTFDFSWEAACEDKNAARAEAAIRALLLADVASMRAPSAPTPFALRPPTFTAPQ